MELQRVQKNLVLLPGLDGSGRMFEPFLDVLKPPYQAVVASYPDHKLANYQELVPSLHEAIPWEEDFILVAESFGGPLALEYAQTYWESVDGIVLCASFIANPIHPWLNLVRHVLGQKYIDKVPPPWLWKKCLLGPYASPVLLESLGECLGSLPESVITHRLNMMLSADASLQLQQCKPPLFYLQGTEDQLVGQRGWSQIERIRPDIAKEDIKGPHMLMQTRPKEVFRAIDLFIRGLDKARETAFVSSDTKTDLVREAEPDEAAA